MWSTLFSFGVLFPLSLPRQIHKLQFTSVFGVLCTVYLAFAVFFVYFCDPDLVVSYSQNFKDATYFSLSLKGVASSFPLIIFAYMY
jgi:amino acid permease